MANSFLITNPTPRASINIINPYMALNTVFPYTITAGVGDIEVSNSQDFQYLGLYVQKVRFLDSGTMSFNAGDKTTTIIKETGLHNLQFQVRSEDAKISCNFKVEVFLNGSLSADRTFETAVKEAEGFEIGKWNIFYQSFLAEEGDEVIISWTCVNTEPNTTFYVDGYKIDCVNQLMQTPTIYSPMVFLPTKWSRLYNFLDTQDLFEGTPINFALFEGTFESNCGSEILLEGVGFKPSRLNSFFTVNCNFLAKIPSGSNLHIDAKLLINGVVYLGQTCLLDKPIDDFQYVNIVFQVPCNQEFLDNDGTVELTAKGNDIEISRRVLTIQEQTNYN